MSRGFGALAALRTATGSGPAQPDRHRSSADGPGP